MIGSRRIRFGDLKRFISEQLVREDDAGTPPADKEPDDSLDSQVDRFLAEYEGEAKSSKTEGLDFRMLVRRLVSEAGDDDDSGAAPPPPAADPSTQPAPAKLTTDDIDIDSFANSVVRLIDNYDNLLEVRSTIAKRAINFIAKVYGTDVVEALKSTFRDDHGLVPGENKQDVDADEFPAPAADRAGEGGAGGAA